ncbi:MAG TPA: TRAFs-binding domain-containing protein [Blastocatellia bacterium]|nr:TRAFs-binding domain-containing protein [Blastocatellia bacterium]
MSRNTTENIQKTCFVVMGFGKKTDFETGRTLDLDKSYRNMIKPAVEEAGLKCVRADEIVHSGLIDVPMYEQLLNADVVVADLSTSNKNAFYELGVRHALRPYTTVVVAEDGIKCFPFDVSHVAIRQYHHLGEDIGFEEVMRFRRELTRALVDIMNKDPRDKDSPVYSFLNGLTPPAIAAAIRTVIENAATSNAESAIATTADGDKQDQSTGGGAPPGMEAVHSILMEQVDDAQDKGDFVKAKALLSSVREMMRLSRSMKTGDPLANPPEDIYIIQRLALVTYKSEYPSEEAALKEARDLLAVLNPETSNDTETLGLWGSVHKHLWELTRDVANLSEAVRALGRGFYLRNDFYNGINLAYLLNVRAAVGTDPAEAIADFVLAQRIRREVIGICEQWRQTKSLSSDKEYWVVATMAEAYFGIGDAAEGQRILEEASAMEVADWMKESTREQIAKLRQMLSDSPLKHISKDAPRG